MLTRTTLALATLVLTALCTVSGNVYAAQGTIEEVIVTAERREVNLQSVPVAVTAFTGEEMDAQ
ncbi:MAG: hypothetical protein HOJ11_02815, partial [Gammaproteobacteria bacterium]|nr:hypothetical protein [Gammaproteobacteria bacterium]